MMAHREAVGSRIQLRIVEPCKSTMKILHRHFGSGIGIRERSRCEPNLQPVRRLRRRYDRQRHLPCSRGVALMAWLVRALLAAGPEQLPRREPKPCPDR